MPELDRHTRMDEWIKSLAVIHNANTYWLSLCSYLTEIQLWVHQNLYEQRFRLLKWKFWPLVQTEYFLTVLCHGLFWCPGVCQWTGLCWHDHWINTCSHDWDEFIHVSWLDQLFSRVDGHVLCIKYLKGVRVSSTTATLWPCALWFV